MSKPNFELRKFLHPFPSRLNRFPFSDLIDLSDFELLMICPFDQLMHRYLPKVLKRMLMNQLNEKILFSFDRQFSLINNDYFYFQFQIIMTLKQFTHTFNLDILLFHRITE